jgi:hypothetical protein
MINDRSALCLWASPHSPVFLDPKLASIGDIWVTILIPVENEGRCFGRTDFFRKKHVEPPTHLNQAGWGFWIVSSMGITF